MKTINVFLSLSACVGLAVLLLFGCSSRQQYHPRFLAMQESEIQKRTTNDVAGYCHTIQIKIDHSSTNSYDWLAIAQVEHYGESGGIERTNLLYRYYGCNAWYPINTILKERDEPALRAQAMRLLKR